MEQETKSKKVLSSSAIFIIMMGIVSLFSDMTHEGAVGINGAFLSLIGASTASIGFVSGLGTLIGYGLRFLTGYIADKKKNYWPMVIIGYAIDLLLIPFLALVPDNGWILACGLLLVGKIGNAIKKPAKDTMVSFATSESGTGKGFAWLEFIDQIGAFLGPTMLFVIMMVTTDFDDLKSYRICYAFLAIPAVLCMLMIFLSMRKFPHPEEYEKEEKVSKNINAKRTYFIYMAAVACFALSFIDFPIITAHEAKVDVVPTEYLPLLYSGAMLIDAFAALAAGYLFDKKGFLSLVLSVLLSSPFALLIFINNSIVTLVFGIIMWGIGMGAQESIMKAAIAKMTTKENRSKGYGGFQLCFGIFWFIGSWLEGYLYDISMLAMIIVSVVGQAISMILFIVTYFSLKKEKIL